MFFMSNVYIRRNCFMNLPYSKTMTPSIKPKVHKNGATVKLVVVSDIQLDFFCEIEDAS